MTNSHLPVAPLSVSTSIAQQVVGESIQLADKPILGPAVVQSQKKQTTDDSASQADAASAADLSAATHRSSCRTSIAPSATDMEALAGESHRSSDSALGGVAEANRARSNVFRAASPPFFFEGDAGEDSLVNFGGTGVSSDASDNTMPQRQQSTASCILEVGTHQQKAVGNHHQAADAVSLCYTAQGPSQQQQLELSQAEAQPHALQGSQAASLCSKEQAQGVAHDAVASAAATLPCPVLQQACGKFLNAQWIGVNTSAASTQLTKETALSRQAGVLCPTVAGNSGRKENDDVGMARVMKQTGDARYRLDRQTAPQSTKPITSSKVILAKVESKLVSRQSSISLVTVFRTTGSSQQ